MSQSIDSARFETVADGAEISMEFEYKVDAFIPKVAGCGAQDNGWDEARCLQFQQFLNAQSGDGWRLHSNEYRQVTDRGCGGRKGLCLICVFERSQ